MQSTHKVPGESASRYAAYLTSSSSRGDYYLLDGKGESDRPVPSQWHGSPKTLAALGLSADRPVERAELRAVMHGLSPADGEPLRPAGSDGTRVAGIEMQFAPPKTVSALWATSSDYRRAQIEAAHRKAVASALARTEREVAVVRRKTKGVVRWEKAERLLAAEFVHTSSRLARDQEADGIPDPQLHTHLMVFAAQRKDGKLAAVESNQLYKTARENGAWYRAELAVNLRELGLQVQRRTGPGERYFELEGVSHELAERWSTRSEDVNRAARVFRQRYGREPRAGELGSLTISTRGSKTTASTIDVNQAWRAIGEEYGQTRETAEHLFNGRAPNSEAIMGLREELLAEVTRERSMVTEHELRAKAYELSAGMCRPAEMDRLVAEIVRSGELVQLQDRTWTTRQLREREQTTINIATHRAGEHAAPVSQRSLQQAQRETGKEIHGSLTQEQREALQTITGRGGMSVLVGRAGTGKGIVIGTAARAWQLEGYTVIGTAVAGSTAQRLGEEAKLDQAHTVDKLIRGVEQGHIKLGPDTVVIMDETGMTDTKRLAKLTELTGRSQTKFLAVGDAAQLGAIGPGGLLKEIENKVPTAELTEVHRANHQWERKAWEQVRAGEPGPAIASYLAHDRLHIHDTRAQAAQAMVENWDRARRDAPEGRTVMITDASNKERDQINAMAQERRAQAGELGTDRVPLPDKPYGLATGDEVIFTAPYRAPGERRVENGITGTIIEASGGAAHQTEAESPATLAVKETTREHEQRVTIRTREREPREVQIDTNEFSDLSLAYAVHAYKGQGMTVETSGVMTGAWQTDKETTYVAISRAREQTQIYVSREDLGEEGMDTGAIERLGERMARSRAQDATITKEVAETNAQKTSAKRTADVAEPANERPAETRAPVAEHSPQPEPERDPYIEQAIQEARKRQEAWEQGIEQERDNDMGFGIE